MSIDKIALLLNTTVIRIGDISISLYNIILFSLVIFLTYWLARVIRRSFVRAREKSSEDDASSIYVFERFVHYIIYAIGAILALASLGVDVTHLALLATALSVGIGFGLQSIFNNFFSGIIILLEKSLKVGDYIELDGNISGRVIEVNVRSTTIRTTNNLDVLVPNSEFVSKSVTNWTLNDPHCRFKISFGVAYGTDKELVKKAAIEAADNLEMTMHGGDKDPEVWLVNFGDSSLDFELVVWVDTRKNKRPGKIPFSYLWEIHSALEKYNIEIPFPQRDLHIKS